MNAEEIVRYEEQLRDMAGMAGVTLGKGRAGYADFDRWLAAHDAQKRAEWEAEQEVDDGPCKAEIWSWDIFRHQEVDPYWMRCHLIGPHEKHENSETGATWSTETGSKR